MLGGLTREELYYEAIVRPRESRGRYLDLRVIETPDWYQVITPSFHRGGLNEVSFARLTDDEADAKIVATLAQYAEHDIRFRWTVTPDCRPLDLPQRLERHGFRREQTLVMVAALDKLQVPESADIRVDHVDHGNVAAYAELVGKGWETDPAPLLAYQRSVLDDPTDDRNHAFLASESGVDVGGAIYTAFARSAFLMGAVVLPEHRSRGAYRSLLAARLRHAAARGIAVAVTYARPTTSAPILARLGFTPLLELPMYFNR